MPGGGLVQDQDARAEPEQAQDLQLLALADGERVDIRLGVEGEVECADASSRNCTCAGGAPSGKSPPVAGRA